MLRQLLFALAFAGLCASPAHADDASKKAKVVKYIELIGLRDMFEQQIALEEQKTDKLLKQIADEELGQLANKGAIAEKLQQANAAFSQTLKSAITPERLATVYGDLYGAHFTEAEIDELIKHAQSDLGRKEIAASKATLLEYGKAFEKEENDAIQKAIKDYTARLDAIVAEQTPAQPPRPKRGKRR